MAETRTIVRVFLASPSDLNEERQLAKQIVDDFNKSWADHLGHQVELMGWEDTVSTYRRPQEAINQDLARCELFIGMMWRLWGTPTGEEFTSGFQEEFTLAERRREKDGAPEIKLLFKKVDQAAARDPGPVLKKVLEFKESIRAKVLYKEFEGTDDFRQIFEACIRDYVQLIDRERRKREPERAQQQANISSGSPATGDESDGEGGALERSTASFISSFVTKASRANTAQELTALEVARFRLIAISLGQTGNDEETLGVHDANVIYRRHAGLALSDREVSGLLDAGLSHAHNENLPLWYWLKLAGDRNIGRLIWRALTGASARRVGALRTMRLMGEDIVPLPDVSRADFVRWLLDAEVEDEPLRAALAYLAEMGRMDDLPLLEQEHLRKNSRTTTAAVVAAIRIALRSSIDEAIALLVRLQPETTSDEVASRLFAKPAALSSMQLKSLLGLRVVSVLKRAVRLLRQRRELTVDDARALLNDDDPELRLEGMLALADHGQSPSMEEARRVLVRKRKRAGLAGLWAGADTEGQAEFELWRSNALLRLSPEQLNEEIESGGVLDRTPWFARVRADFQSHAPELRRAIEDDFRTHFQQGVEDARRKHGNAEYVVKLGGLEDFIRQQLMRSALTVVCEKGSAVDLERVRKCLMRQGVNFESSDLSYLVRHGEWRDVDLLIGLAGRTKRGSSLLGSYLDSRSLGELAQAIISLGSGRTPELMTKDMPDDLRVEVVRRLKDAEFSLLDDVHVNRWARSKSDELRKAIALKAVSAWPRKRAAHFLNSYMAGEENYFYNVVHWLDLAIAMPRQASRRVARLAAAEALSSTY